MESYKYSSPHRADITGIERKALLFSIVSTIMFFIALYALRIAISLIHPIGAIATVILYTALIIVILLNLKKQRLWLILGLEEPTDERESIAWGLRSAIILGINIALITILASEIVVITIGNVAIYAVELFVISYFISTFGGLSLLNVITKRQMKKGNLSILNAGVFKVEIMLLSLMNVLTISILTYILNIDFLLKLLVSIAGNKYSLLIFLIGLVVFTNIFVNNTYATANELGLDKDLNEASFKRLQENVPHRKMEAKYADILIYGPWFRRLDKWVRMKD